MIISMEPVAKLQFGPKSALAAPDSDFLQIAYTHSYMFDLQKTEPALRSSNLGRKASFATGSMECAGLIYDESLHYLDHLAPFCSLAGIPLILCEPQLANQARFYYPDLNILQIPLWDLVPSLPKTIITCEPQSLIRAALHVPHQQTMWLPHGNSDKGWKSPFFEALQAEEFALVYGDQMIDTLRKKNPHVQPIRIGNFRWTYYQKHKSFYQTLCHTLTPFKKSIHFLYAPTWEDVENNCSFWDAFPTLAAHLPPSHNLLVKLHPNTQKQHEAKLEQMIGLYAHRENIAFLPDFPPIYPLLEYCQAYIGDMSSIGYDFLAFLRPMFFLNPQKRDYNTDRSLYLHRCGQEMTPEQIASFCSSPLLNPSAPMQEETYAYAFGTPCDIQKIFSTINS